MFDDEFTLLEYGNKVQKISSKNYVVKHNNHQYGKFFIYSKVEIWYEGELVASTSGNDGKKRRFKHLYLSFIENIGKFSEPTINNFLTVKTAEKTSVYTEREYQKLSDKKRRSIRGAGGQIVINGNKYYAANNLNISEYIYCIYERVPENERDKVIFKFFGISEDDGCDIVDKSEIYNDSGLSNLDAAYFEIDVITEHKRTKNIKTTLKKESHRIDYQKADREKISVGEFGEKLVYFYEKNKLLSLGKKSLARKVKIVSENSSLGYDIISFDENGEEIHIEVKSTKKNVQDGFYLSANELSVANDSPDKYYIYRIYGINEKKLHAKMYIYEAPFNEEQYVLCPVSYFVKGKKSN